MTDMTLSGVLDATELGFSFGPADMVSTVIGGRVLVYALSRIDNRITTLELTASGWTVLGTVDLVGTWQAGVTPHLSVTDLGLMVGGLAGDPLLPLDATGLPTQQTSAGSLAGPRLATDIGPGLIVSARADGTGLDLFSTGPGGPVWTDAITDTAETNLTGPSAIHAFTHLGAHWLVVASSDEDGITLLRRNPDDTLAVMGSIGAQTGLPINDPRALATAHSGGDTYILIAARVTKSLSVVRLSDGDTIQVIDHVLDTTSTFFADAAEIATATHQGFVFVAISGSEGGVTLLTLLPNGRLQKIEDIADTTELRLHRPTGLSLDVIGDTLHLSVASLMDKGLTSLTLDLAAFGQVMTAPLGGALLTGTALGDQIIGSDVADTLDGGDGDDILFDGSGMDVLKGGPGADLFVFAADGLTDTILGYEPGIDRLDLSSFAFLRDVAQLQITPTPDGATITYADEVIRLFTANATSLPSGSLTTSDILDLDRAILSTGGQSLKGSDNDDTIIGGSAGDTIQGGGGSDAIAGAPGDDMLIGQDGADTMTGGAGADSIEGDDGDDAIRGDAGNDWISGGPGADILLGDGEEDWSPDFDWGGI